MDCTQSVEAMEHEGVLTAPSVVLRRSGLDTAHQQRWPGLDANGDGVVDESEYEDAMQRAYNQGKAEEAPQKRQASPTKQRKGRQPATTLGGGGSYQAEPTNMDHGNINSEEDKLQQRWADLASRSPHGTAKQADHLGPVVGSNTFSGAIGREPATGALSVEDLMNNTAPAVLTTKEEQPAACATPSSREGREPWQQERQQQRQQRQQQRQQRQQQRRQQQRQYRQPPTQPAPPTSAFGIFKDHGDPALRDLVSLLVRRQPSGSVATVAEAHDLCAAWCVLYGE